MLLFLPAPDAAAGDASAPRIEPASVEASGRREALLTVPRPGRYAVSVTSAQGCALRLVDRMAGPGKSAGEAGAADGRLDLLLDGGTYKLIYRSQNVAGKDEEVVLTDLAPGRYWLQIWGQGRQVEAPYRLTWAGEY